MAIAMFVTGLVMNITGVALGSSRDLASLARGIVARVGSLLARVRGWFRLQWSRVRRQHQDAEVLSVSGHGSTTSCGSGTFVAWNPVPDGIDLPTAIERLRSRTDNLYEIVNAG